MRTMRFWNNLHQVTEHWKMGPESQIIFCKFWFLSCWQCLQKLYILTRIFADRIFFLNIEDFTNQDYCVAYTLFLGNYSGRFNLLCWQCLQKLFCNHGFLWAISHWRPSMRCDHEMRWEVCVEQNDSMFIKDLVRWH